MQYIAISGVNLFRAFEYTGSAVKFLQKFSDERVVLEDVSRFLLAIARSLKERIARLRGLMDQDDIAAIQHLRYRDTI